jgi:hypothetical protein
MKKYKFLLWEESIINIVGIGLIILTVIFAILKAPFEVVMGTAIVGCIMRFHAKD